MTKIRNFLSSEKGCFCLWAVLSVLGILMQMLICSRWSLTYDSAYQYALTGKSFPEMLALLPADFSPPLYAVLLKLVNLVSGENLFYYRLFNSIPFAGMLYLSLFPVRKLFGTGTGWMSAFLAFFSVINLRLFNDIRPTYLAYFFVSGLVICGFQAFFSDRKQETIKFTVFAILCMYTHNIALVAAFGVYLVCLISALCTKNKKKFLKFLLSGIVSLICYLPWLFVLLHQIRNVSAHYWEGLAFTPEFLQGFLFDSIFQYQDDALFLPSLLNMLPRIGILLILLRYFRINPKASAEECKAEIKKGWQNCRTGALRYGFLCLELVLPLLVFAVINENFHRIATDRYFFILTGLVLFLMALSVVKSENRILCTGFCVLILCNFAYIYGSVLDKARNIQGKQMIQEIQEAHPDGEIAFLHTHEWTIGIMMYFFPDAKHYVCDDTWTVLTDLSVFPSEVINIGSAEHITDYTDDFYFFDMYFPGAVQLEEAQFYPAEAIRSETYRFAIIDFGILTIPKEMTLKEIRMQD